MLSGLPESIFLFGQIWIITPELIFKAIFAHFRRAVHGIPRILYVLNYQIIGLNYKALISIHLI